MLTAFDAWNLGFVCILYLGNLVRSDRSLFQTILNVPECLKGNKVDTLSFAVPGKIALGEQNVHMRKNRNVGDSVSYKDCLIAAAAGLDQRLLF